MQKCQDNGANDMLCLKRKGKQIRKYQEVMSLADVNCYLIKLPDGKIKPES